MNNIDHLVTMQCSAVKPRVLTFMWMQLDMQYPDTIAHQAHLLMVTTFLDSGDLPRKTIYPATLQKTLMNGLMNMTKSSRHQPGHHMTRRSDPWMPDTNGNPEVLCLCVNGSSPIHSGASMDQTGSHGWVIGLGSGKFGV